jgi:HlyD family secretion protein
VPIQEMPTLIQESTTPRKPQPVPSVTSAPPKRNRSRKTWMNSAAVVLLICVAALAWRSQAKAPTPAWGASDVRRSTITKSISATGKVDALTTVNVGSQVSGTVSEIYVDFNSPVKKGQIIAKLDPSQLQAQLTQSSANQLSASAAIQTAQNSVLSADAAVEASEANVARAKSVLDDAQRNLDLTESMVGAGVTARREIDPAKAALVQASAQHQQAMAQLNQAKAQAQSARSQVNQARAQSLQAGASVQLASVNLENSIIKAPIDGVVVARNVDVGQTVAASLQAPTLFLIANDLKKMQVLANIDEADIGQLGPDSRVTFTVDAFPLDVFAGKIAQIRLSPQTLQNVVTYTAVVQVNNPDLKLKPGMTANITAIVAERKDVVAVPNAALRFRPADAAQQPRTGPTVWKIEGEKLTPVPVKLGITDGVVSEVISGDLERGDRVAVPQLAPSTSSQPAARNPMMPMGGGRRR